MKFISVNVSLPRTVIYQGKSVTTGIFKKPVGGRVMLRILNLDGDQQADRKVHGGVDMAVYAYPIEHYRYWQTELAQRSPMDNSARTSRSRAQRKTTRASATSSPSVRHCCRLHSHGSHAISSSCTCRQVLTLQHGF